jgi:hypothetical protein
LALSGGIAGDSMNEVKESISEIVGKFKCNADYTNIANHRKRKNTEEDVVQSTRDLLTEFVNAHKLSEPVASHILANGEPFLRRNQATRSLFFVRLNAYMERQLKIEDIFDPKISKQDIDLIHPVDNRDIAYYTRSPDKRLSKFMDGIQDTVTPKNPNDSELLQIIVGGDENKLFRGICRKAFMVSHGNVSGSLLVTHEAQAALLDKISFISDTRDIREEKRLANAMMALMFTSDQYLWNALARELSDVSYYKTELFGKVSFTRGIFAEERENLVQSIRVVVDICIKELRKGGDLEPIIDTYFGEHAGYVKEQISKGVLLEMSERFNCEDIGFMSFGIKTSLSENHDAMQRLSDSLDLLHNRFDGFKSKLIKQDNKPTFK